MGKLLVSTIAIGSLIWLASPSAATADEMGQRAKKRAVAPRVIMCGDLPCVRVCPDGFSCYPLYGAYGPYGGVAYWGAYTLTGWGPYFPR
jgi:hypothetical protein